MASEGAARKLEFGLPLGRSPGDVRRRIESVEHLLERCFVIPGTNRSIRLDSIVGVIPVAGDAIGAIMGLYLVWEARNLGLSRWKIARMIGNVGFDAAIGVVPFAGDILDFLFRSNTRNLRMIRRHLDRHHPETRVIDQ